ncbi:NADH:flavin oxidoreductase/NADH oxidase [Alcaligenaceae bacterium]|nr:NADH:flavin oxidoreductase/NADH oxidase [Alcaligenaceae bacterium]
MSFPLFTPFTLGSVTSRNRLVVSPMCQYAAVDGMPNDWHLAHLGRFAQGGFGIIMLEATAVVPEGRITHGDLGLWSDDHIPAFTRLSHFIKQQGVVPAIQLGHAGRKASSARPWHGNGSLQVDGPADHGQPWLTMAPSAIPMAEGWHTPKEMTSLDMETLKAQWVSATQRALQSGFEFLEVHAAHGYLLHSFLSPLSNLRQDAYGGDLDGRMKFPLEVVEAVRAVWPDDKPLAVRISAVDGLDGGISIEDSTRFAQELKSRGVDIVDCSSGGIAGGASAARVARKPGFQVPFAQAIRAGAGIKTMAVGLIMDPVMANDVVAQGQADLVALGREALVNPNWPLHAYRSLTGDTSFDQWPVQAGWWLDRREWSLNPTAAAAG